MRSIQSYVKFISAFILFTCSGAYAQEAKDLNSEEKILQQVERKKGFRPYPLRLMAKRESILPAFMNYGNALFENGPLSAKEVYLIALSAAVALNSPTCIRAHTKSALENGATREEVIQSILISGLIGNTAPLHIAGENTLKFLEEK